MTDLSNISGLIGDLKENYDVEYWGSLLDEYDQRLAELHKNIDGAKYTEWGLVALKAIQGDAEAKSVMGEILEPGSEDKKMVDEMALLYLVQPVLRHYLFRASNRAQEMGPPA
ncbi:MAG: hypothetical protein HN731_09870 [Rhodospirillaceae bacterium]|jgi:hypothetical protein|nr:hypothetical protein [Rhodospirillaceae bacterium]MBT7955490.1 hypothetical protein [Rhodospirillaceae bacterium]